MVEFAISSLILLLAFTGIMDLAFLYAGHVATHNAVRAAARYAAANPKAWTTADPPAANTIEGQLKIIAIPAVINNTDAQIGITYTVPGAGAGAECGYFKPSTGFVADPGYTQATCVVPGHLVTVKATYDYVFITPFLKQISQPFGKVTISTQAAEIEET